MVNDRTLCDAGTWRAGIPEPLGWCEVKFHAVETTALAEDVFVSAETGRRIEHHG